MSVQEGHARMCACARSRRSTGLGTGGRGWVVNRKWTFGALVAVGDAGPRVSRVGDRCRWVCRLSTPPFEFSKTGVPVSHRTDRAGVEDTVFTLFVPKLKVKHLEKMTHWFHRNPLKATAPVSFNYYGVVTGPAASKICSLLYYLFLSHISDLRSSRARLLELFTDLSCNPEMMKNAADSYFSLLQGFINSLDESTQESKLRYIQNFKWTDTLQGQVPSAQQDAVFELISMGFNVALWYTKYASRLAGKENITEDEAKEVHRSLKIAAGIFKHLKESHIPKLITPAEKGRDLEARLIEAYIIQCQAEAQEVTIARAIELKHAPGLIAALAYETANFYQKADHALSSLEPAYSAKWRKYLHLKMCFYTAYAYCYHGQTLLASDKCGEAIRSLQEAEK
ncbi:BROX [Cervus elaphus hippelaphus]|uniref:BRO1 domain-containing protein BROX n=1 Tax=Cervus elaphus hippelaphus TaxID=46360 RepID=A0A212CRE6_CEREH|nr:BROX [Cervus elaphus hippelaphus]